MLKLRKDVRVLFEVALEATRQWLLAARRILRLMIGRPL